MKRTVILACGVVALLAGAVYVSRLLAQAPGAGSAAPAARPAEPRTRIALLNLMHVINNYDKAKSFRDELKSAADPFQKRETACNVEAESLAKEMNDPKTPAEKREADEKRIKELRRILEDNKTEGQKVLIKKQEEQLKILFMDIRAVCERYAQAHNFDMVLHYNDAVAQADYWSAANLVRKIQAGALMPLYYGAGQDISQDVINALNSAYKSAPRPAAAAPATGAAPAPAAPAAPSGR